MPLDWRGRIVLLVLLSSLVFGDFGFNGDTATTATTATTASTASTPGNGPRSTTLNTHQQNKNDQALDITKHTEYTSAELSQLSSSPSDLQKARMYLKEQMRHAVTDSCLPKMLCEIGAKPISKLTEKEQELLQLVRSSAFTSSRFSVQNKWYFASHMGELYRYTGDEISGPIGCANLWPNCPISSKTLLKLSRKIRL